MRDHASARTNRSSRRIAVAAVITAAAIPAGVAFVAFGVCGSTVENRTAPFEPRLRELPGGFSPLPEFELTPSELAFRDAQCRENVEADDAAYRLIRRCVE